MSDLFKGITFPWQDVTPSDDAIIRKAVLPDRRLSGCELTYSGYTLTMTAGVMIVCGRQFRHTAAQNWAITGATSGYARLLLAIDTTKASTEDAFEQISVSVEYATAADGFPELRQDNINSAGSIYQASLCVIALGPGGITGIAEQIIPGDNVFHSGRLVSMDGHRVTDVAAPVENSDAVNLGYANEHFAPAVESHEHPGCFYRMVNGVQEWINPPMIPGVEYRTTGRYEGKPVYTEALTLACPSNGASTEIDFGTGRTITALRSVVDDNYPSEMPSINGDTGTVGLFAFYAKPNGKIYIQSTASYQSGGTCRIFVEYTKN